MKYKVKVIAMLVKGNKMANHGEILEGNSFLSDAEDLVKSGFLTKVDEEQDTPPADIEKKKKDK